MEQKKVTFHGRNLLTCCLNKEQKAKGIRLADFHRQFPQSAFAHLHLSHTYSYTFLMHTQLLATWPSGSTSLATCSATSSTGRPPAPATGRPAPATAPPALATAPRRPPTAPRRPPTTHRRRPTTHRRPRPLTTPQGRGRRPRLKCQHLLPLPILPKSTHRCCTNFWIVH